MTLYLILWLYSNFIGLNTGAHDKDREAQNVEAEPVIVNRSYLIRQSVSQNNEERPFRCNVCLKSFKQVAHLTTHKRIHSDEKPHKCNICGQSFRSSSHLKQHVKIHTGEKPYPCEVCGKSFRQSAHLKNHICRGWMC